MNQPTGRVKSALRLFAPLAGCAALAYGCQDSLPTAPRKPPVYLAQAVQCTVSVPQQSMTCNSGEASIASSPERALAAAKSAMVQHQGHPVSEALVGHPYVAITSQNFFHDIAGDRVLADVKVQNLMAEAAGSADGTTYDGIGVDVFFTAPPAAPVTINNATGTGTFTGSNQSYFQYPQLVPANGLTAPQSWVFGLHGQPSFDFIVFVSTQVPTDPLPVVIPPHTLPSISAGYDQLCAIRGGSQAYCWGTDSAGQLGDGRSSVASLPVAALGAHVYSSVAAGPTHGCGIEASTAAAFCWGKDSAGALGDGGSATESAPTAVSGNRSWSAIAAGTNHSCAIETATNNAYCWGANTSGQLGIGTFIGSQSTPSLVVGGQSFTSITSGHNHSCALTGVGVAYCWGANAHKQLGDNTVASRSSPTLVLGAHTWKKITAGGDHTCGIDTSNAAWCWGSDANGELGDNSTLADKGVPTLVDSSTMGQVKTISAGSDFTCAVDVTVAATGWCWGDGSGGQLGDGSVASPINFPTDVTSSLKWTSISAGESHACGIDNLSHAYCWGAGARGQIGDGVLDTLLQPGTKVGSDTYSAVAAGGDYACAISVSKPGTGWCWGYAIQSTLANGFLNQQSAPLGVLGNHVFSQITASQHHSCALDAANAAWCWGDNSFDELGTGDETPHTVPVAVSGGLFFSQLSSFSFESNCARVTGGADQSVYCWGLNEHGELGNNTTTSAPSPVLVTGAVTTFSAVSAGYTHTCAVRSAGATYCWGANVVGELGDGTTGTTQLQPQLVPGFSGTAISAGFEFTCAIETAVAHHIWCWGNNTNGQLGINSTVNATVPTVINGGKAFTQVTTGGFHACALEQGTGNAYCWGANNKGQLGVGSFFQKTVPTLVAGAVTSFVSISAGSADPVKGSPITCASTAAGASYCWGSSYGNEPTLVTPP